MADVKFEVTRIIKDVEYMMIRIPQPFNCDRCGLIKVGYMRLVDGQELFEGFYHMGRTPEMAKYRRNTQVTHKRLEPDLLPNSTPDKPIPNPKAGEVKDVTQERDEYTVCASCMHQDPAFLIDFPNAERPIR